MKSPAKISLFIDVQNIYYTCRDKYQQQFNYRALWKQVGQRGKIINAFAYATENNKMVDKKQQSFQKALQHIGFTLKLKPYIQRADGSAKGDWDVGITIDVLEQAEQSDIIILASGDGDFDLLLNKVGERYGCRTEVYGIEGLTALSLIKACDTFHAIDHRLLLKK